MMPPKALSLMLALTALPLGAQEWTSELEQHYELQYSAAESYTPLWLNANRYGLSSLDCMNGYVRAGVERSLGRDDTKAWGYGYGVDAAAAMGHTSDLILQQCFAELRYRHGVLTIGQKEQPLELRDARLSSGSQTLGINASPVPGIRLGLPVYYDIPGTGHWLAFKGHISYGRVTDDDWQLRWTSGRTNHTEGSMLHTKAGYLRIGPADAQHPLSFELGLEMACQFGGTMYHTQFGTVKGARGPKAWLDALLLTGGDEDGDAYRNVAGNHLGSWVARLTYDAAAVRLAAYADHYFEDNSAMVMIDFDGYGYGAAWNERARNLWLLYPLRDMQYGVEVELRHCPWLRKVVVEYLDTRYQSGPIYHDHNATVSDHIGGDDSYYNHYLYQGWSHWGQVMGNPLYRSPLYNDDHTLTVADNRFYAWHVGLSGRAARCDYRALLSWQQGYGTYQCPLLHPQRNLSLMAEATFALADVGPRSRCAVRCAVGLDRGELLGDNTGAQFTIIYHINPDKR